MTLKELDAMTNGDLWKWALGLLAAVVMFLVGMAATDNRARLDRLDRDVDAMEQQRQQDAGDLREMKANVGNISWRLDRIDQKLDRALGAP